MLYFIYVICWSFQTSASSNAKGYITLGIKLKSVNVMKGALHDLALVCLSRLISDQSNLPSGHTCQCGLRQMCHAFSCCRSPTFNSFLDFTDSSSSLLHPFSFLLTFGAFIILILSGKSPSHQVPLFCEWVPIQHRTLPKIGVIKYTPSRKYINTSFVVL